LQYFHFKKNSFLWRNSGAVHGKKWQGLKEPPQAVAEQWNSVKPGFLMAFAIKKATQKKKQEFRTQRIQNSCPLAFTSIGESLSAYLQADFNIAPC